MKRLAPDFPPAETTKLLVLLKTMPVGAATAPAGLLSGVGMNQDLVWFWKDSRPAVMLKDIRLHVSSENVS
jgi:hypothetical protein